LKITISKENYLKAIAEAESEGELVIAATLARWLKVSAPAVTMALKRLKRDKLIDVSDEGHIKLTASGKEIAQVLIRRHHLIERMLTEVFGMDWYRVHEEADREAWRRRRLPAWQSSRARLPARSQEERLVASQ